MDRSLLRSTVSGSPDPSHLAAALPHHMTSTPPNSSLTMVRYHSLFAADAPLRPPSSAVLRASGRTDLRPRSGHLEELPGSGKGPVVA